MGIITSVNEEGTAGKFVHAEGGKGALKTTESKFDLQNPSACYGGRIKITNLFVYSDDEN